jgi:hypothetical protein
MYLYSPCAATKDRIEVSNTAIEALYAVAFYLKVKNNFLRPAIFFQEM